MNEETTELKVEFIEANIYSKSSELSWGTSEEIEDPEWCFQFNDDEPTVFTPSELTGLTINLPAESGSNIVFSDGKGKKFKLFCRKANK